MERHLELLHCHQNLGILDSVNLNHADLFIVGLKSAVLIVVPRKTAASVKKFKPFNGETEYRSIYC